MLSDKDKLKVYKQAVREVLIGLGLYDDLWSITRVYKNKKKYNRKIKHK